MPAQGTSDKRPTTSNSASERRTLQSSNRSHSTGNRFSNASTETGESSRSASTRASTLLDIVAAEDDVSRRNEPSAPPTTNSGSRDSRMNHRSRQSRSSGGFLLSNAAFELPVFSDQTSSRHGAIANRRSDSSRDHKGKPLKDEGKPHKKKSSIGLGIVGSPLASNVTNAGAGEETREGHATLQNQDPAKKEVSRDSQAPSTSLDMDSAQIVNLALNLSEHRKLAARRNISTPIPSSTAGFEEALAGGSLKYHLQQQRRSSRNISPKPEKIDRNQNTSPRLLTSGQRTNSGFRGSVAGNQEGEYHYYFSPSTLARAEKARNAIELMAQYRRALQYVPPLRPTVTFPAQPFPTPPGTSSTSPGSTTLASSRPVSAASTRLLGRPYNPLQYIRNRRVRARERRTLDGESEGFSDVDKVKAWVDQISSGSVQQGYGTSDIVPIPLFPGAETKSNDPSRQSPQSSLTKNVNPGKYKRPRMDWIFTPEDLLSDLHWLEQGDNKKCIEDRHGQRIFPQRAPLKRPTSREGYEPAHESVESIIKTEDSASDHRVDVELPKFKSIKPETTRGRARQKLHDTIHGHHHRQSGSISESHWKNRSESDISKSEDDNRFRGIGRSRSREPPDPGRSLLEKQMMELIAKEAREAEEANLSRGTGGRPVVQSIESQTPSRDKAAISNSAESSIYSSRHVRQASHRKVNSRDFVGGRSSLEVPYARASFEGFDSTAPNSPLAKASNPEGYIPNINMNLSPSPSRESSPTRKPLQKVRSKINKLRDRSRHPTNELDSSGHHLIDEDRFHNANDTIDIPASPEPRRRSTSPTKRLLPAGTDSTTRSLKRDGSIRRKKGEEDSSGLRGFIKGGRDIVRGPVSQVKDFIWKKDASPGSVDSSASLSEDSDDEGISVKKSYKKKSRNPVTKEIYDQESTPEVILPSKSYLKDMPSFHSPAEQYDRTRPAPLNNGALFPQHEGDHVTRQRRALSSARSPRFDLLKPPRIDVQTASPTSSPDFPPIHQVSHDSDMSDLESRRTSYVGQGGILGADARLNAILGIPGHLGEGPPMTALARASLEKGSHGHRHSEIDNETHRPSLGSRQWSISDRAPSHPRGPITKREIARVRALLLSSGVKAKEIARREEEIIDLRDSTKSAFSNIATTMISEKDKNNLAMVPKYQEHVLAARILSSDMQLSSRLWQSSATNFTTNTVPDLTSRIHSLKDVTESLTAMCRTSADEADALGRDLVGDKTMAVKRLADAMEMMHRRRRRRFRWIRRGGWVLLEWVLVGVMWWVWLIVVLIKTVRGVSTGVIGGLRWLFWL